MVPINKSGTDQRIPLWKLTLYNAAPRHVQHHSELKNQDSLNTSRNLANYAKSHPKIDSRSVEEAEEEIPLHGTINEEEAKAYRERLDKIFEDKAKNIKNNIANAMELAIIDLRAEITKDITGVEEVDTGSILKMIRDPTCLALGEQTEDVIEKLEEILPDSETASGGEIIKTIDDVEVLTEEQKHDIGEIFDNLEIAHENLG